MFEEANLEVGRRSNRSLDVLCLFVNLENPRTWSDGIHSRSSLCAVRTRRGRLSTCECDLRWRLKEQLCLGHTSNLWTYWKAHCLRSTSIDTTFRTDGLLFRLVQTNRSTPQWYDSTRSVRIEHLQIEINDFSLEWLMPFHCFNSTESFIPTRKWPVINSAMSILTIWSKWERTSSSRLTFSSSFAGFYQWRSSNSWSFSWISSSVETKDCHEWITLFASLECEREKELPLFSFVDKQVYLTHIHNEKSSPWFTWMSLPMLWNRSITPRNVTNVKWSFGLVRKWSSSSSQWWWNTVRTSFSHRHLVWHPSLQDTSVSSKSSMIIAVARSLWTWMVDWIKWAREKDILGRSSHACLSSSVEWSVLASIVRSETSKIGQRIFYHHVNSGRSRPVRCCSRKRRRRRS